MLETYYLYEVEYFDHFEPNKELRWKKENRYYKKPVEIPETKYRKKGVFVGIVEKEFIQLDQKEIHEDTRG